MKRLALLIASTVVATGCLALAAPHAFADYGNTAEYQVTFSQNCNNASYCGNQLGGSWGWVVFNNDGTGDAQITFCGHSQGGGGAGHVDVDIEGWKIAHGMFVITAASDPQFVGPTGLPATPGHYNLHPAPGVAIETTVVEIPNR